MNDNLIDRFELWNEFEKRCCEIDKGRSFANKPMSIYDIAKLDELCYGMKLIQNAPPVDAVVVVRCKNCKHRHSSEFCECRPEDAFCSDGERRE